ncbi:hypothetical protein AL755_13245 [Arthrobacter sp. ERGS1:01]|uniref:hypothetical protein n=1 Tax=Arthrobacter sp. ERGS1:01 TaxID=1704044 RepID=UPI0006B5713C|nr:hypothetical protein [Arthrobacter sp. ERGS1:01]ALE06205.1 hypothetical protein AL755_13245 [Arthrobacter sp. ERGS1:01]
MSEAEGPRRLQPKMTRGGFRFQFVLWSIWTGLQLVVLVIRLGMGSVWDPVDYLVLAALILGVVFLVFLLYVRHHDGHFWDEEEATRDDWDRRGRGL